MTTESMNLCEFLVRAKVATYASKGEAGERILEDGSKELSCSEAEFSYRDRYYGFDPFVGEEIVWRDGKIAWVMNYYGGTVVSDVPAKDVYDFLKKCLRQVNSSRPFRGPEHFIEGDFEYVDHSYGGVDEFQGKEQIFFGGEEVYRLRYHGGAMQKMDS